MLISTIIWVSTIVYGLLGLIWSSKDWANVIVKFMFLALTVCCVIILYQQNGFTGIPLK